ncbi:hypothetical protein ACTXT7_003512, partial [Hymenolepis weldensis]
METENSDSSPFQAVKEYLIQYISEFHYEPEADRILINGFEKCEDVSETILTTSQAEKKLDSCYEVRKNSK